MFSYHTIALLLYHVFLYILQHNVHVAFDVQLHIFRIVCKDHTGLFTLSLNHYVYVNWSILPVSVNQPSVSLHLLVVLYCSMYFRRHDGGSRSGSGLWLSDCWYVGLSYVFLRACAGGLWMVCECAICAIDSIRLYTLHILYILHLHIGYFFLWLLLWLITKMFWNILEA